MNPLVLLLYAIFAGIFLLMAVPSIVACYRYWFGGGKLLSERLDPQFRSVPAAHTHTRRKISERNPPKAGMRPESTTDPSVHSIQTHKRTERREEKINS